MSKKKEEKDQTRVRGISTPTDVPAPSGELTRAEDITTEGIGSLLDVLDCLWCHTKLGCFIESPWSCQCLRQECHAHVHARCV